MEIPDKEEIDERMIECNNPNCSNEQKFKSFNNHNYICDECSETKVVHNIYASSFGIIVPGETDIIYVHQTAGVCCHQIYIEGSFIPFREPFEIDRSGDETERINFITLLSRMNYVGNNEEDFDYSYDEVWEKIREKIPFEYEEVNAPEGHPYSREALKWVRVTDKEGGAYDQLENLEGKVVALTYANSD